MKEIKGYRKDIDKIDNKIKKLLLKRADCVVKIGEIKKQNNIDVYDVKREKEILDGLTLNLNERDTEYIKSVYLAIFSASKEMQK